jgi:oxygen-independent coproporphyrinogen-3 oxidase
LRLAEGVDVAALDARYDADIRARYGPALERPAAAGLLAWDESRLRLTRRGMLLANEILSIFV